MFVVVLLFLVLFLSLASLKLLLVRASRASASTNRRNVALVMSLPHISVGKGMSDLFGGCMFFDTFSMGRVCSMPTYVSHMGRCGWEDTELFEREAGRERQGVVSFLN